MSNTSGQENVDVKINVDFGQITQVRSEIDKLKAAASSLTGMNPFAKLTKGASEAVEEAVRLKEVLDAVANANPFQKSKKGAEEVATSMQKANENTKSFRQSIQNFSGLTVEAINNSVIKFDNTLDAVKSKVSTVATAIKTFLAHPLKALDKPLLSVQMSLGGTISTIKRMGSNIKQAFSGGEKGTKGFGNGIKNIAKISVGGIFKGVTGLGNGLKSIAKVSVGGIVKGVTGLKNKLMGIGKIKLSSVMSGIKNLASGVGKGLASAAKFGLNAAKAGFAAVASGAKALNNIMMQDPEYAKGMEGMKKSAQGVLGSLTSGLKGDLMGNLMPQVTNTLDGLNDAFASGGLDGLLTALPDGLSGMMGAAAEQLKSSLPKLIGVGLAVLTSLVLSLRLILPDLLGTIVDGLMQLLGGLVTLLQQQGGPILQAVIGALGNLLVGLSKMLPQMIEMGVGLIGSLIQGLTQATPSIITALSDSLKQVIDNLGNQKENFLKTGKEFLIVLANGFTTLLPQLLTLAIGMIATLAQGLAEAAPTIVPILIDGILQGLNAIIEQLPVFIAAGIELIAALGAGFIEAIPQLLAMLPQVLGSIIDGLLSVDWIEVGKNIIGSVWDGIKSIFGKGKDGALQIEEKIVKRTVPPVPKPYGGGSGGDPKPPVNEFLTGNWGGIPSTGSNTPTAPTTPTVPTATTTPVNTNVAVSLQVSDQTMAEATKKIQEFVNAATVTLKTLPGHLNSELVAWNSKLSQLMQAGLFAAKFMTQQAVEGLKSTLRSTSLYSGGEAMMNTLANGISGKKAAVISAVREVVSAVDRELSRLSGFLGTGQTGAAQPLTPPSTTKQVGKLGGSAADVLNRRESAADLLNQPRMVQQGRVLSGSEYTPQNSSYSTQSRVNVTEHNNYSPSFKVEIQGGIATKEQERIIKRWIKDGLYETFNSMARKTVRQREV